MSLDILCLILRYVTNDTDVVSSDYLRVLFMVNRGWHSILCDLRGDIWRTLEVKQWQLLWENIMNYQYHMDLMCSTDVGYMYKEDDDSTMTNEWRWYRIWMRRSKVLDVTGGDSNHMFDIDEGDEEVSEDTEMMYGSGLVVRLQRWIWCGMCNDNEEDYYIFRYFVPAEGGTTRAKVYDTVYMRPNIFYVEKLHWEEANDMERTYINSNISNYEVVSEPENEW